MLFGTEDMHAIMGDPSRHQPVAIWSFLGCKTRKPTTETVKYGL